MSEKCFLEELCQFMKPIYDELAFRLISISSIINNIAINICFTKIHCYLAYFLFKEISRCGTVSDISVTNLTDFPYLISRCLI